MRLHLVRHAITPETGKRLSGRTPGISLSGAGQEMKAKYPLAEAKVVVEEVPGKPGAYNAVAWMRPWLQLEELTASLRMVARIPQTGG